jgi:hypothetical protein
MKKIEEGDYAYLKYYDLINDNSDDVLCVVSHIDGDYIIFTSVEGNQQFARIISDFSSSIISVHSKTEMIQLYPELMI